MTKPLTIALAAAALGATIVALAQPRADLRPAVVSVGTSSSNGISFAWFYDPAERGVIVCRTGATPGEAVDCKARATLP